MPEPAVSDSASNGTRGARLGTRLRGALADAYQARGHHCSNLTFVYSPKAGVDVVLRSSLEYGHFLLCEASANIEAVDYGCERRFAIVDARLGATEFDAIVTLITGEVQYREIKSSEEMAAAPQTRAGPQLAIQAQVAAEDRALHVVLTEREIFANAVLIRNWNRVVPWLAQVRDVALNNHFREVAALVRDRGAITLSDVLALGEDANAALFAGAAFKGVQRGLFASDLDTQALSLHTRFAEGRAQ